MFLITGALLLLPMNQPLIFGKMIIKEKENDYELRIMS
jgi:hypothetical protein